MAQVGRPVAARRAAGYSALALTRKNDDVPPAAGTGDGLFVAACSITTTRRRRFLWAAWWTAPPARLPFRKPDASAGGARSHDEALAQARLAAGVPLVEIEPRWARAWARVLLGQAPWTTHAAPDASRARARPGGGATPVATKLGPAASIWDTLGITARATPGELKSAFRRRALATHPDRGGDPEAFRAVQSAFQEAQRRLARRGPARRRQP